MVLPPLCSLSFSTTTVERGRKQSERCLRAVDKGRAGGMYTDTVDEPLTSYLIVRKKDIVKALNYTDISSAVQPILPSTVTAASSVQSVKVKIIPPLAPLLNQNCLWHGSRFYIVISATCLTSLPSHPRKHLLTSPSLLDEGSHWHQWKANFSCLNSKARQQDDQVVLWLGQMVPVAFPWKGIEVLFSGDWSHDSFSMLNEIADLESEADITRLNYRKGA